MIKCVILDDELLALSYLKLLCEQIDDVEVIKAFNNPNLFLSEIENLDCNLCILDIEMPGTNGLQIAQLLSESKKIIFTTAYKEYAAEAFDLNVVDYVRKPIKKERLIQAFEKAKDQLQKSQKKDSIEWNTNLGRSIIFTEEILHIKTSDIDSRDKEVLLTNKNSIVLKNLNFKNLLEMLPDKDFIQINKKEIISINSVKALTGNEIQTSFLDEKRQPIKLQIGEAFKNSVIKKLGDEI